LTVSAADILDWAWQRHHNMLSWYIRPLFMLPLAWLAYRRSGAGIVATLIALATSMFWFPAPDTPDARVGEFLAFERDWLTGPWTLAKVVWTSLVPAGLGAYCLVFWKRSLLWGAVLLNLIALGKLFWGVTVGAGTGWAMTVPALAGLLLCDVVLVVALQMRRHSRKAAASS
jgi:hypothetical protein